MPGDRVKAPASSSARASAQPESISVTVERRKCRIYWELTWSTAIECVPSPSAAVIGNPLVRGPLRIMSVIES